MALLSTYKQATFSFPKSCPITAFLLQELRDFYLHWEAVNHWMCEGQQGRLALCSQSILQILWVGGLLIHPYLRPGARHSSNPHLVQIVTGKMHLGLAFSVPERNGERNWRLLCGSRNIFSWYFLPRKITWCTHTRLFHRCCVCVCIITDSGHSTSNTGTW